MIDKVVHTCIIGDGPDRGNTHYQAVESYDIISGEKCEFCCEKLADFREILAALYEEAVS